MKEIVYRLSVEKPHRHFLDLEAEFPASGGDTTTFQLPAWRPGRYELGNFAKNIQRIAAFDQKGRPLTMRKVSKDKWEVDSAGQKKIVLRYNYFAGELNAGSTWVDQNQIYVNPVNCFFYIPKVDMPYRIELDMPKDAEIACGLRVSKGNTIHAAGVQEVMDSPFIAAAGMTHWTYDHAGVKYHIWINGRHTYVKSYVLDAFSRFTQSMVTAFGDIPCEDYHFLFQLPDQAVRHGVEHTNSTVIALGPAEFACTKAGWEEILGISCHELYHTWNIKSIRPKEMMPYDFATENYSKLGYVAEGVTTYYGDLYLYRAGVFDQGQYFALLADQIKRHLHNSGRFNMSVADSSFDTWLDGYAPGIPDRKVSIYTEGCLIAFITDVAILNATAGKKSLDNVMFEMYQRFGKKAKGYTAADYQNIAEKVAGTSLSQIFDKLVNGTEDFLPFIEASFKTLGLKLTLGYGNSPEHTWGLQVSPTDNTIVHHVWPDSPADEAGFSRGDKLIGIDGISADAWWRQTVAMKSGKHHVQILRNRQIRDLRITALKPKFYPEVSIERIDDKNLIFNIWEHTNVNII
jgi:predicted metalloprotease with PDZ domain